MPLRLRWILSIGLILSASTALADDYTLETVEESPDGLSAEFAELIDPAGHKIVGPRRDYCDIWLLRDLAVVEGFEPQLSVKYPLTPGQLIGVLRVPRRSGITDFRGQELEDGLFTLRYGQQPVDGNHIGTSETSDFLMALPADDDQAPAVIESVEDLNELSAAASGTNHPAIFSLLPAGEGEADGETSLEHDEDHEFYILRLRAQTTAGETLPLRLVVVGESDE